DALVPRRHREARRRRDGRRGTPDRPLAHGLRLHHARRRLPGRSRHRGRDLSALPRRQPPRLPPVPQRAPARPVRGGRRRRLCHRRARGARLRDSVPDEPLRSRHARHASLERQHCDPQLGLGDRGDGCDAPPLRGVPRDVRRPARAGGRRLVSYLPFAVAAWICLVGIAGIATSRNLIHLAICLTVTQSSSYVLLLSVGYVKHGKAPIFIGTKLGTTAVDPVVQALTLTDIVVSVVVIALILALALDAHRLSGTVDPDQITDIAG